MAEDPMAKLLATRITLRAALNLLSIEKLRILLDTESGTLADLTEKWAGPERLSGFQQEFLDEIKRINFRLALRLERMESGESKEASAEDIHFYCIQCNMPAPYLGLNNLTCPTCGSTKFLEAI